jgi:hypothetical protein
MNPMQRGLLLSKVGLLRTSRKASDLGGDTGGRPGRGGPTV